MNGREGLIWPAPPSTTRRPSAVNRHPVLELVDAGHDDHRAGIEARGHFGVAPSLTPIVIGRAVTVESGFTR